MTEVKQRKIFVFVPITTDEWTMLNTTGTQLLCFLIIPVL